MKRMGILLSAVLFTVVCFAQIASSQQKSSKGSVAGTWTVTARLPEGNQTETWTLKISGDKVTGSSKGSFGDTTIDGTFDNVGFLRVDQKAGDKTYKVRATIDGDSLDGSITTGVGKEYLWQARRTK